MAATIKKSKSLYYGLIGTFAFLWLAVAFVSTLHAIAFFQITNSLILAILLGTAYEIGQMSVLFSILMTENKNRPLAWGMLFLLTGLQVTANVYASFRFMEVSGSVDWTYWQKSVLLGVQLENEEMYKIVISWISGALLPIVALGLTSLVADNIAIMRQEKLEETEDKTPAKDQIDEIIENEVQKRLTELYPIQTDSVPNDTPYEFELIEDKPIAINPEKIAHHSDNIDDIDDEGPDNLDDMDDMDGLIDMQSQLQIPAETDKIPDSSTVSEPDVEKSKDPEKNTQKPVNKMRGWHLMNEYVDDEYNVFSKGLFVTQDAEKTPTSKKA
jgi:hypothetical protein